MSSIHSDDVSSEGNDAYSQDEWPLLLKDGNLFDGTGLYDMLRSGNSPFEGVLDVKQLIEEVEEILGGRVVDIPKLSKGANFYGFHLKMSGPYSDVVARLGRSDFNMPKYAGISIEEQVSRTRFEARLYYLLSSEPGILLSHLIYHRVPVQRNSPDSSIAQNIIGRPLFLFEKSEGKRNMWYGLCPDNQNRILSQAARIRASLFNCNFEAQFARTWLLNRLVEPKPEIIPVDVDSTRKFCIALITSKVEATTEEIENSGSFGSNIGPIIAAAKSSILNLIPHILPEDNAQNSLYRFVIDHGDFGLHNMTITVDSHAHPLITSLFDFDYSLVIPALLSDPMMTTDVDLLISNDAEPYYDRAPYNSSRDDYNRYSTWSHHYFEHLFHHAPSYKTAIQAGGDARYLWFALRDWKGDNPERFFRLLGDWAERRARDLGIEAEDEAEDKMEE